MATFFVVSIVKKIERSVTKCRECRIGRVNDLPRLKNRCLPKPRKAHVGGWRMGATSM
jgi:hypothetical protein